MHRDADDLRERLERRRALQQVLVPVAHLPIAAASPPAMLVSASVGVSTCLPKLACGSLRIERIDQQCVAPAARPRNRRSGRAPARRPCGAATSGRDAGRGQDRMVRSPWFRCVASEGADRLDRGLLRAIVRNALSNVKYFSMQSTRCSHDGGQCGYDGRALAVRRGSARESRRETAAFRRPLHGCSWAGAHGETLVGGASRAMGALARPRLSRWRRR